MNIALTHVPTWPHLVLKHKIFAHYTVDLGVESFLAEMRREVLVSPAVTEMQSFKCCGRRPFGPAPEPCGKEEIAARIWSVLKQIDEVPASGGSLTTFGAWGCFC